MAVERAKRVAERGGHAVLIVDSLAALPAASARKVLAGGRNTEEAGSVTLIAAGGVSAEAQRAATTRIVLSAAGIDPASSGTLRAELLS